MGWKAWTAWMAQLLGRRQPAIMTRATPAVVSVSYPLALTLPLPLERAYSLCSVVLRATQCDARVGLGGSFNYGVDSGPMS